MTEAAAEDPRLSRLTDICLALPETSREVTGEHASFQVRKKTFAWFLSDHHGDGMVSVCCRMALGENADRVKADPERFYLPAYVAHRGWVALRLDLGEVDWREVAELVADSYSLVAPKKLAQLAFASSDQERER
ncbi:MAG TPA: MmcQ/YjbR family DNA-binding protein [Thermoanaerobaculia bacterium]|nr:MmcQ/YjbR family DNA-binding protein [Thermoanaerobaculia bacterium]